MQNRVFQINNVTYTTQSDGGVNCNGCAGEYNGNLCFELRVCNSGCDAIIFKEVQDLKPADQNEKSRYDIAIEVFREYVADDSIENLGFEDWCETQNDPEYAEFMRLKAKFEKG